MGLAFTKEIKGNFTKEEDELFTEVLSTLLNDRWILRLGEYPYINYIKAELIFRGTTTKPGIYITWRRSDDKKGKNTYDWNNITNPTGVTNRDFLEIAKNYKNAEFALVAKPTMREDFTFDGYDYNSAEDIGIITDAFIEGYQKYSDMKEAEQKRLEGNKRWEQLMEEYPNLKIIIDPSDEDRFIKDVTKSIKKKHEVLFYKAGGIGNIISLVSGCLNNGMNYGYITGPYGDYTPPKESWPIAEYICNFYWKNKGDYTWK